MPWPLKNRIGSNDVTAYWLDVQNGPSRKRYSVVKNFEFVGGYRGSFFSSQKKCINKGKQYKWLVYEPRGNNYPKKLQDLEDNWKQYKKKLGKHDDELVQRRVLALETEEEPLSWNFTIYENELCIVERAQEDSFGNDNTIIILDDGKVSHMEKLFTELWNVCPSIDSFIESGRKIKMSTSNQKIINDK